MNISGKRILVNLLVLALVITMMPSMAFAQSQPSVVSGVSGDGVVIDNTANNNATNEEGDPPEGEVSPPNGDGQKGGTEEEQAPQSEDTSNETGTEEEPVISPKMGDIQPKAVATATAANVTQLNNAITKFNAGTTDMVVTITASFNMAAQATKINNTSGRKLTLTSSPTQTLTRTGNERMFYIPNGTLEFNSITLVGGPATSSSWMVRADSPGKVIFNDGCTLKHTSCAQTVSLVRILGVNAKATINGGNFIGSPTAKIAEISIDPLTAYGADVNLDIKGGTFSGQKSTAAGGVVSAGKFTQVRISGGTFSGNYSSTMGGAIYVATSAKCTITGGNFLNNTSPKGKDINVNTSGNLYLGGAPQITGGIWMTNTLPQITSAINASANICVQAIANNATMANNLTIAKSTKGNVTTAEADAFYSPSKQEGKASAANVIWKASTGIRTYQELKAEVAAFNAGSANKTITLSEAFPKDEPLKETLNISKNYTLTIASPASNQRTIKRHPDFKGHMFNMTAGTLNLNNVILDGVSASGVTGSLVYKTAGTLNVNSSTFKNNYKTGVAGQTYNGGAICNSDGTVNISSGTFSSNKSSYGGAIFNGGTMTVNGATFSGSSATTGGHDIFNANGGTTNLQGKLIIPSGLYSNQAFNTTVKISGTITSGSNILIEGSNQANQMQVGTIVATKGSAVTEAEASAFNAPDIIGSPSGNNVVWRSLDTVDSYTQLESRLAAYTTSATDRTIMLSSKFPTDAHPKKVLTVSNGSGKTLTLKSEESTKSITRPSGYTGHLINVASGSLNLENMNLDGANVSAAGSLINKGGTGALSINGVTLKNNQTSTNGGAINHTSGTVTVKSSTISGNKGANGGAIYSNGQLNVEDSTFSSNTATLGNDVYLYNSSVLSLSGTTKLPSGVYSVPALSASIKIASTLGSGSDVYIEGTADASQIAHGKTLATKGSTVTDAEAAAFHAIDHVGVKSGNNVIWRTLDLVDTYTELEQRLAVFSTSTKDRTITLSNTFPAGTSLTKELEVKNTNGKSLTLSSEGTAKSITRPNSYKGDIFKLTSTTLNLTNVILDGNKVADTEGALILNNGGTLNITAATLRNNISTVNGGAINNQSGTLNISGGTFIANKAVKGNDIYINSGVLNVSGAAKIQNGIYSVPALTSTIKITSSLTSAAKVVVEGSDVAGSMKKEKPVATKTSGELTEVDALAFESYNKRLHGVVSGQNVVWKITVLSNPEDLIEDIEDFNKSQEDKEVIIQEGVIDQVISDGPMVINNENGATLTLKGPDDEPIVVNRPDGYEGTIIDVENGNVVLENIVIDGGSDNSKKASGPLVIVKEGTSFTLSDNSELRKNNNISTEILGGAVNNAGTFNLNGGKVNTCQSTQGGGIFNTGILNLSKGTIDKNKGEGKGIYALDGKINFSGNININDGIYTKTGLKNILQVSGQINSSSKITLEGSSVARQFVKGTAIAKYTGNGTLDAASTRAFKYTKADGSLVGAIGSGDNAGHVVWQFASPTLDTDEVTFDQSENGENHKDIVFKIDTGDYTPVNIFNTLRKLEINEDYTIQETADGEYTVTLLKSYLETLDEDDFRIEIKMKSNIDGDDSIETLILKLSVVNTVPAITKLEANRDNLSPLGGKVTMTIEGKNLDGKKIYFKAFEGAEETDIGGVFTYPQNMTITFPQNDYHLDKVYTVKVKIEDGEWFYRTVRVTVEHEVTPPEVMSIDPAGEGIDIKGNIVITFNESVDIYDMGTIKLNGSFLTTKGTWSQKDTVYTIPYDGYAFNREYLLIVENFKDLAGNKMTAEYSHEFRTKHNTGITLSQNEEYDFDNIVSGYEQAPDPLSVDIKNIGSRTLSKLDIRLGGPGEDAFVLSKESTDNLLSQATTSFTVRPVMGLKEGVYIATVTVTNDKDITEQFDVRLRVLASNRKDITDFAIDGQLGQTYINQSTRVITVVMPPGTDVSDLTPQITHSGIEITPEGGISNDFTTPQLYKVTAEDGTYKQYTVYAKYPEITQVTAEPADHEDAGGNSIITINGDYLVGQKIKVQAYEGRDEVPTEIISERVYPDTFTLRFPENPSHLDKIYTIKATIDGSEIWVIGNNKVTVKHETTPPELSRLSPSGNNVAINGDLVLTFSEPMEQSIVGTIKLNDQVMNQEGSWSADGTKYTISYSNLDNMKQYKLSVSGFKDIAGNLMRESTDKSFTTEHNYGMELSQKKTHIFESKLAGYRTLPDPLVVEAIGTGTGATGALTVSISGGDKDDFTVSRTKLDSLTSGSSDSFEVSPKLGLTRGYHEAIIKVTGKNGLEASFTVGFTVVSSGTNTILEFQIDGQIGDTVIDSEENKISLVMPYDADLSNLTPTIVHEGKSITPDADESQNFEHTVYYTVEADNGNKREYEVIVEIPDIDTLKAEPTMFNYKGGESTVDISGKHLVTQEILVKAFVNNKETDISQSKLYPDEITLTFPANDTDQDIVYALKASLDGGDTWVRGGNVTVKKKVILPEISKVGPEGGTLPVNGTLDIDFTKTMDTNVKGSVALNGKTLNDGIWSEEGTRYTVAYTGLSFGEKYIIQVKDFADIEGNLMEDDFSRSFFTGFSYEVELDPSESYEFEPENLGYEEIDPLNLNIKNVGTGLTGKLNISLKGENASSFKLSKTVGNSLMIGASDKVSVSPKTGLFRGEYNAQVVVRGNNGINESIDVSFLVTAAGENKIKEFHIDGQIGDTIIDHDKGKINVVVPYEMDLYELTPTITHTGIEMIPESGETQDFSSPVKYKVTAPDDSIRYYDVVVETPEVTDIQAELSELEEFGGMNRVTFDGKYLEGQNIIIKAFEGDNETDIHTEKEYPNDYILTFPQNHSYLDKEYTLMASLDGGMSWITGTTKVTVKHETVRPMVESVLPSGSGVELNGDLFIKFNEPMSTDVIGSIVLNDEALSETGVWSDDMTTYKVPYKDLKHGTLYKVVLRGFADLAGNVMRRDASGEFTTLHRYGLDLSQTSKHKFETKMIGYIEAEELKVTAENTGTIETGALNITLDGNDADSFELSATTMQSIDINDKAGFSVAPLMDLEPGIYEASVTVSGDNNIEKTFQVEYTVEPCDSKIINELTIEGQIGKTIIDHDKKRVLVVMPYGTNVTSLAPTITYTGISITPESGIRQNFRNPVTYRVEAQDDTARLYDVTVEMPTIEHIEALSPSIPDEGGKSVIEISGKHLDGQEVLVKAFYNDVPVAGAEATVTYPDDIELTFPENLNYIDKEYTVKASVDGGKSWFNNTAKVTVAKESTKPEVSVVLPMGPNNPLDGELQIKFSEEMNIDETGRIILDGRVLQSRGEWSQGDTMYTIPYGGLEFGTDYTVTIDGFSDIAGNVMDKDESHSFKTKDSYGLELSQKGEYKFDSLMVGYEDAPKALTVIAENKGTARTGDLQIRLGGLDKEKFELSEETMDSITAGSSSKFEVRPLTGLNTGTYTATVIVTGENNINESFKISFTVDPSDVKEISEFKLENQIGDSVIDQKTGIINVLMPYNSNLKELVPTITYSGIELRPDADTAKDFDGTVEYKVFAEDGTTKTYYISVRTPQITGMEVAGDTFLESEGGRAMIRVSGSDLNGQKLIARAFNGNEPTDITGTAIYPNRVTLNFPENTDWTDKSYTIKVSIDNGVSWIVGNAAVIVGHETTAPEVEQVSPTGEAVSVKGKVSIKFSEEMRMIQEDAKVLLNDEELKGQGVWSDNNQTYTMNYNGLDYDTEYTVDIRGFRDKAGNVMVTNNANTFTTIEKSELELNIGDEYTFAPAVEGRDDVVEPLDIIITAQSITGDMDVSLSGENADAFKLSDSEIKGLEAGESHTLTITPVEGLAIGQYKATLTISDGKDINKTINITHNVYGKDEKSIELFRIPGQIGNTEIVEIDEENGTIHLVMPMGTDLSNLTPKIKYVGAGMNPKSDKAQNFEYPVIYKVADGNAKIKEYSVTVETVTINSVEASPAALETSGGFANVKVSGKYLDNMTITAKAFLGDEETDITASAVYPGDLNLQFPANDHYKDKNYTVKVSLDGGNTWAAKTASVTVAHEDELPEVTAVTPGGIDNKLDGKIKIKFSEPMATSTSGSVTLVESGTENTIKLEEGTWSDDKTLYAVDYSSLSHGKVYSIIIDGFEDLAGNVMTLNGEHEFKTIDLNRIVLSQKDEYEFKSLPVDYNESPDALDVTVTNAGTAATGELKVALSGDDSNKFTLSDATLESIDAEGHEVFSVRPDKGLGEGTYKATVKVTGEKGLAAEFDVSFTVLKSDKKAITEFAVEDQDGETVIDHEEGAINFTMPYYADVTELVPSITHSGVSISPESGEAQDFTTDVEYTVTADDGSEKTYTARATVPEVHKLDLSQTDKYEFDSRIKDYVELPDPLVVTAENTGNMTLDGLKIALSGTSPEAFRLSKTYLDTMDVKVQEDFTIETITGLDLGTYEATVTVTGNNDIEESFDISFAVTPYESKDITSFEIEDQMGDTTIDTSNDSIQVLMPAGTDLTYLAPVIKHTGESISPESEDPVDFTEPVIYTVTAANGSTKDYTVTVEAEPEGTPPTVESVLPEAEGADISGQIAITFNKKMLTYFAGTVSINDMEIYEEGRWSEDEKTYTIPYDGLDYFTEYSVKIDGFMDAMGSPMVVDDSHSFTTIHNYEIEVNWSGEVQLESLTVGYEELPEALNTVIDNTGTGATGELSIGLSGEDADKFEVVPNKINNIEAGSSESFDINPVMGLEEGTYMATVIISGDHNIEKTFDISVNVEPRSEKRIIEFTLDGQLGETYIDESAGIISVLMPYGSDLNDLTPDLTHTGVDISPAADESQDFTNTVTYTVTAFDGSEKIYEVYVRTPEIYEINGIPSEIETTGGESEFLIIGSDIEDFEIYVEAYDEDGEVVGTGSAIYPQAVKLTFPENPTSSNKVYTIKASLDGGASWVDAVSTVTVGHETILPTVEAVSPSGVNIPVNGDIQVRFSEPMNTTEPGIISLNGEPINESEINYDEDITTPAGIWSKDSMTYTVPYKGIDYGTKYTISIRDFMDVAGNGMDEDTSGTFTTEDSYIIELSHSGELVFDPLMNGYMTTPEAVTAAAINTGTGTIEELTVGLQGENADAFKLNKNTLLDIEAGESAEFEITPEAGLKLGTYKATVVVTGGYGIEESFDISVDVVPSNERKIIDFVLDGQVGQTNIDEETKEIKILMPYGSELKELIPTVTYTGISIDPATGAAVDFDQTAEYTVTAENGDTTTYFVKVRTQQIESVKASPASIGGLGGKTEIQIIGNGMADELIMAAAFDGEEITDVTGSAIYPENIELTFPENTQPIDKNYNIKLSFDGGKTWTDSEATVTVGPEEIAPTVESVTPSGVDITVNGDIEIQFNEAMNTSVAGIVTLNGEQINEDITNGEGDVITEAGIWSEDGTVYTVPYKGLEHKTKYNIGIEGFKDVSGNVMAKDESNEFITVDSFEIELTQKEEYAFDSVMKGYETTPAAMTAAAVNTGTGTIDELDIAIEDDEDNAFVLNKDQLTNIETGKSAEFEVSPVLGLASGTHTAAVVVTGKNEIRESFTVSFTVDKSDLRNITEFVLDRQIGQTDIDQDSKEIKILMPYGSELKGLTPTVTYTGIKIDPTTDAAVDFDSEVEYKVTAEDGEETTYKVMVRTSQLDNIVVSPEAIGSLGGKTEVEITGTEMDDQNIMVAAFDGEEITDVTGSAVYPDKIELTFPENTHPVDKTFQIKLSFDSGKTWVDTEKTVTVGHEETAPIVKAVKPTGEEASVTGNIRVKFDEPMNTTDAGIITINGEQITAAGIWSDDSTIYSVPYKGLDYKTEYTVGIKDFKDLAGNVMESDDSYMFTTLDKGEIELNVDGEYAFPIGIEGHDELNDSLTITIGAVTTIGSIDIGIEGDDAFDLSKDHIDGIPAGESDSFTITPKEGLPPGEYTATITITDGNGINETITITHKVYGEDEKFINSFSIPGQIGKTVIDDEKDEILVVMPVNADIDKLTPQIDFVGVGIEPESDEAIDFSNGPVDYKVTDGKGEARTYKVMVEKVSVDSVEANPAALETSGGAVKISLSGDYLSGASLYAQAFLGEEATDISGSAIYPDGPELVFPANDHHKDKAYTVKVSMDNGETWLDKTAEVTVGHELTPPEISNVTPNGNNIELDGNIVITFNEPMKKTTDGSVKLSADGVNGTDEIIPAEGTWSEDGTEYTAEYEGLSHGTEYTVTVDGFADLAGNEMAMNNNYGFKTINSYKISLSETGEYKFDSIPVGYESVTGVAVTVSNKGTASTGELLVRLEGDDADKFTLSTEKISNVGLSEDAVFTVTPNADLDKGTYEATVKVTGNHEISEEFTVSFTVLRSDKKQITDFAVAGQIGDTVIDEETGTIDFVMPYETDLTALAPIITHSGISVTPESGDMQDFTDEVVYTVEAEDETTREYTAKVTLPDTYKLTLSQRGEYNFEPRIKDYEILPEALKVTAKNTGNMNLTGLTAELSGASAGAFTISGTAIDELDVAGEKVFTIQPVGGLDIGTYEATVTVKGDNEINESFNIKFAVNPYDSKEITGFTIEEQIGETVIDEEAKTIEVLMPSNTDVTKLAAVVSHTGESVTPASGEEADFTNPVTYTVTAGNGTTQDYEVTVTLEAEGTPPVLVSVQTESGANSTDGIARIEFNKRMDVVSEGMIRLISQPIHQDEDSIITELTKDGAWSQNGRIYMIPYTGLEPNMDYQIEIEDFKDATGTTMVKAGGYEFKTPHGYSIDLSQKEKYTFEGTGIGYEELPEALEVGVANTGTDTTGKLDITLNGTGKDSFDLSANEIEDLNVGDSHTFTIQPKEDLEAGVHKATVTVSGDNGIEASFDVEFEVYGRDAKDILAFNIPDQVGETIINEGAGTITVVMPQETDVSALKPVIKHSGETVIPANGSVVNFEETVEYTVLDRDGHAKKYQVTVTVFEPEAERYGIGLSQVETHEFITQMEGYDDYSEELKVSVRNRGNMPTGKLNIELTGNDASNFIISKTTIDDLDVQGKDSFTVQAKPGLGMRTYNAKVVVTGDNDIREEFSVKFKVSGSDAMKITGFNMEDQIGPTEIDQDTKEIKVLMAYGTDVTNLTPEVRFEGRRVEPSNGEGVDFTDPVDYKVVSGNGNETIYTVTVSVEPAKSLPEPINVLPTKEDNGRNGNMKITFSKSMDTSGPGQITLIDTTNSKTISVSDDGTWTKDGRTYVTPYEGLDFAKEYQVMLIAFKDKDGNVMQTNSQFSFTTLHHHEISLDVDDEYQFESVESGFQSYDQPLSVTVTNEGTTEEGPLTVELAGDDADKFQLSNETTGETGRLTIDKIDKDGTSMFSVEPVTGLTTGSYRTTVKITGANGISQSFTAKLTVDPASTNEITSFEIEEQVGETKIDHDNGTIEILMVYGSEMDKLTPTIEHNGVSIDPASRVTVDLNGRTEDYTVTAENGDTRTYTVTATMDIDNRAPEVLSVTPNSEGTPLNGQIKIEFSKVMSVEEIGSVKLNGTEISEDGMLAKGGRTFVIPYTNLSYETEYTVEISGFKDKYAIEMADAEPVTFKTVKEYDLNLSQTGTHTFENKLEGYAVEPDGLRVKVSSKVATGNLKVELGGYDPEAFKLSAEEIPALSAGQEGTFKVTPITDLNQGTYEATVIVKDGGVSKSFDIKFTVEPPVIVSLIIYGNGGSPTMTKQTTKFSGHLGDLPMVTRQGYVFAGWYLSKTSKDQPITSETIVDFTKMTPIYAHWVPVGSALGDDSTDMLTGLSFEPTPPVKIAPFNASVVQEKTVAKATVKFNANKGKVGKKKVKSVSKAKNKKIGKLPVPKRKGYKFKGWYTKKIGGKKIKANTKITKSMNLYAKWKKK